MTTRRDTITAALDDALESLDVARNQLGLWVADLQQQMSESPEARRKANWMELELADIVNMVADLNHLERRVSDG